MLDTKQINRICLLDANTISKTSDALRNLCQDAQDKSAGCNSDQGLTGVLVLSSELIPELVVQALDASVETLSPPLTSKHHTPAEAAKARHATVGNAKVKNESAQGDDAHDVIDWIKAYDSFLRMIVDNRKNYGLSKSDFATALPHIQVIIKIAERYQAVHVVQNAFSSLLVGYVEHHTLYSTIGKWPARCLMVGVALKSRLVYDEAFKHLVGSSASFKNGKTFDDLSDDVQAIVQRRAQKLYHDRMHVMLDLMSITLAADETLQGPDYPTSVVSQHQQAEAYCVVNIFRDWMNEHISYLRSETIDAPGPSYLCPHQTDCATVAGFLHTIMAGGDSYLPSEKVKKDWDASSIGLMRPAADMVDIMNRALASLNPGPLELSKIWSARSYS